MGPLLLKRLSDEKLGGCLATGEAAAFDELYRRYSHRLSAYAGNLLDDPMAGDDVAQTTLLKAYQALRAGNLPDAVRPWLYRIAHNVAIDLALRPRELPSDNLPEGTSERPYSAPLLGAIAALTDHQRRVYVLRELHGLRIDETSRELGLTSTQVEQALFAARNRLAEHLVFGERLGCPAVRRLAAGPLDSQERRAVKAHLRACRECRGTLGSRGAVLQWLPALPLDWLRSTLTLGGAPAAAKISALVAATTLAVGVPVAVKTHDLRFATRAHHPAVRRTVDFSTAARPATRPAVTPRSLIQPVVSRTSIQVVESSGRAGAHAAGDAPETAGSVRRTEGDNAPGDGQTSGGDGGVGASVSSDPGSNSSRGSGDGGSGDSHSGDSHSGDSHSGDSHSGDSHSGDSHSGDSHSGGNRSGDGGSGDGGSVQAGD